MEEIIIDKFLVIKNARFEVNKINIIIGSQANGKSLVAKLLYFFREFLNTTYINSVKELYNKSEVEKLGCEQFQRYFPKYTWEDHSFKIIYKIDTFKVSITNVEGGSIKLDYSKELMSLHIKLKNSYRKIQAKKFSRKIEQEDIFLYEDFDQAIRENIYEKKISSSFSSSLFIPASRSFFANLQKNVFSFLASNIDIDPFINDFGSKYEHSKRIYTAGFLSKDSKRGKILKDIEKITTKILVGKYLQENDKDWIQSSSNKINLSNASSGQQEALPMLLILSIWPLIQARKSTFFIEEPEAHLFPISQKYIISLLALIYNSFNHNLVITTHSPYVLTAINNLILANDVLKSKGHKAVEKIVDPSLSIKYEDVSAYTIEDGILTSIMDDDARLIGSSVIDSVSEEFDYVFDSLLTLQMG